MSSPQAAQKSRNQSPTNNLPHKRKVDISYVPFAKIELEELINEEPGDLLGLTVLFAIFYL
jgi:hypothetical protein